MKATLEFNLPEDKDEFTLACKASSLYRIIADVKQHLRDRLKYADFGADIDKQLEIIRDLINKSLIEEGIEI